MAEQEDFQRTEEPTPKKLEDAIKEGNVAFSREVTNFVALCLFTVFVILILPSLCKDIVDHLKIYVDFTPLTKEYNNGDIIKIATKAITSTLMFLAIPFVFALIASLLSSFVQNGIIFSSTGIMPKFSKISPISGFKRIFSVKSIVDLFKAICKIVIISVTLYLAVIGELKILNNIYDASINTSMVILLRLLVKMMIAICIIQFMIAIFDYMYEKFSYIKKLRMTKQEVKDEHKESEGDPKIKSKIRAIRVQRARQRVIALVPKADLVISNPTHYCVALKYESDIMPAPKLIAKGQDMIALQMKKIAKDNSIPIIEDKPLARSIFDSVDWDEYIKAEHYRAVAQILSKLRKFKRK